MKATILKAFKDGSNGNRYEIGQIVDIADKNISKFETLGLVSKVEEEQKPKKTSKKLVEE